VRPQVFISTSVGIFITTWTLAHGVPVQQALLLAIFTLGVSSSGALVWNWLCQNRRPHPLESFAAGFVLASSMATVLDQLLVEWTSRFGVLRWAYLAISIIFVILWAKRSSNSADLHCQRWHHVLPLAFAAVSSAQTGSRGWAVATVLFLLVAVLLYKGWHTNFNLGRLVLTTLFIALSNATIYVFRPTFTSADWRLFRLFTGSDDQIYSEAASNSLVLLGPFESIFSLHTHVPYHWFTFAWTGNFGHLIGDDAFTGTLHIAPLLGLLFVAILVWAVATIITEGELAGVLAIVATFAMSSSPAHLRFIHLMNTSNIVSHLWLLLALLLLARTLSSSMKFGLTLLSLVSALALLAKVPYGLILYSGLGAAFICAMLLRIVSIQKGIAAICSLLFTAALTSKIFLDPQPWQDRGFRVLLNSANFALESRLYPLAPIVLILAIAVSRFPYYLIAQWASHRHLRPITAFFIVSTSVSLVRFLVIGASAENYFLSAGLLFAGVGIGVFWGTVEKDLHNSDRRRLMLVALVSASVTVAASTVLPMNRHSNWLIFFPIALGGVGFILNFGVQRPESSRQLVTLATTTFATVLLGSGIGSFLRIPLESAKIEPSAVVSQSEIESLEWIRQNTGIRDILATNRNLCGQGSDCNKDETRQVVAAFGDRQVLIEGPRFLNGARDYPDWAKKRIRDVLDFAALPNTRSLNVLRTYGVDWFYLIKTDPRVAPMVDFERLATPVMFENSDVAIIDLRVD
jgi:hypothetical protein